LKKIIDTTKDGFFLGIGLLFAIILVLYYSIDVGIFTVIFEGNWVSKISLLMSICFIGYVVTKPDYND